MFDIGFGEMLLLAAIALIALGPKQLPEVARTIGRFLNLVKRATEDFKRNLTDANQSTNKHFDSIRKTLAENVLPTESISAEKSNTQGSTSESAQLPQEPAGSVDNHQQMSFKIDKKE